MEHKTKQNLDTNNMMLEILLNNKSRNIGAQNLLNNNNKTITTTITTA